MKKSAFFLLIIACFFALLPAEAADKEKIAVGPGMELLEIGTVRVIVPKGTLYEDKGSKVEVEGIGEYVGRRFLEVEAHFSELEAREEVLRAEIEELKQKVEQLQQKEPEVEETGPRLRE